LVTTIGPRASLSGPFRIFICYRRDDTGDDAARVYQALVKRYGTSAVFMDRSTLPPGSKFAQEVKTALGQSRAVLVLIGETWLKAAAQEDGRRRLDDRHDFVRREMKISLRSRAAPTIPVLLHDTQMPKPKQLPRALRKLPERHAFEIREGSWDDDLRGLCSHLDSIRTADTVAHRGSHRFRAVPARPPLTILLGFALSLVLLFGASALLMDRTTTNETSEPTLSSADAPRAEGLLKGHNGWVEAVATAQLDGHPVVVSAGDDATVRIWDPVRYSQIGDPLKGHTGGCGCPKLCTQPLTWTPRPSTRSRPAPAPGPPGRARRLDPRALAD
jgi:hypothetical protein